MDNLEVMESSLMQIIINRSSVCAGDDIQDHSKIYDLSDDVTYSIGLYKIGTFQTFQETMLCGS